MGKLYDNAVNVLRYQGDQLQSRYGRYQKFAPAAAFFAGMLWDILTLGRIDEWFNLIQLGAYLLLTAGLLSLEARELRSQLTPPGWLTRVWPYRNELTHFLLGGQLSAYTLFFLKSSTLLGSFLFYLVILLCLVGNEFERVRRLGIILRLVMFTLCLVSYFNCLMPLLWGRVGFLPFLTAIGLSAAAGAGLVAGLARLVADPGLLRRRILAPVAGTLVGFLLFYGLRLIPPVPLALTGIGIYRSVDRVPGGYKVTWARPAWKFWQSGDQTFAWRAGEKVYCFFSVFSPGGFQDRVQVRWLYDDPQSGWSGSDAIPVGIKGGRAEGYRGFVFKQSLRPGRWQVRVETVDDREIGRINLTVEADDGTAARELKEKIL